MDSNLLLNRFDINGCLGHIENAIAILMVSRISYETDKDFLKSLNKELDMYPSRKSVSITKPYIITVIYSTKINLLEPYANKFSTSAIYIILLQH